MAFGIQIYNASGNPTVTLSHETRAFVASGVVDIPASTTHTEVIAGYSSSDPSLVLIGPHGIGMTKTFTSTGFTVTSLSSPVKAYYWVFKR
jgi:hypothetical protein